MKVGSKFHVSFFYTFREVSRQRALRSGWSIFMSARVDDKNMRVNHEIVDTRCHSALVIYQPKYYVFNNILWRVSYWRASASYLVDTRGACQLTRLINLINSYLTDHIHPRYVSDKAAVAQWIGALARTVAFQVRKPHEKNIMK